MNVKKNIMLICVIGSLSIGAFADDGCLSGFFIINDDNEIELTLKKGGTQLSHTVPYGNVEPVIETGFDLQR